MAYSLTQLETLEKAISSGATRVSYDGKSVEYRSLSEMILLRDTMRRELGLDAGGGRRTVARFSSAFRS